MSSLYLLRGGFWTSRIDLLGLFSFSLVLIFLFHSLDYFLEFMSQFFYWIFISDIIFFNFQEFLFVLWLPLPPTPTYSLCISLRILLSDFPSCALTYLCLFQFLCLFGWFTVVCLWLCVLLHGRGSLMFSGPRLLSLVKDKGPRSWLALGVLWRQVGQLLFRWAR